MAFDADLPLRPGVNVVTIVARENPDTTSHRTFIVRRDGPNGELLRDAEDGRRAERDRFRGRLRAAHPQVMLRERIARLESSRESEYAPVVAHPEPAGVSLFAAACP